MKLIQIVLACILMLVAATALAANKQKFLICHVDNAAGKIDLIVVSNTAKHLGNPSHTYGGISDYAPGDVGASSNGTEDSDGNGVDDGCEPPETCPCWDEIELLEITSDNYDVGSCEIASVYPAYAIIRNNFDSHDPLWRLFEAQINFGDNGACYSVSVSRGVTRAESEVCIEQIAARCSALGHPLPIVQ